LRSRRASTGVRVPGDFFGVRKTKPDIADVPGVVAADEEHHDVPMDIALDLVEL
jgi:hypothetical protein